MSQLEDLSNRRAHERLPLRLPVSTRHEASTVSGRSEDFSVGGAKLRFDEQTQLRVGQHIDVDVDLPGTASPLQARAEVRWSGGKGSWGVAFDKKTQAVLAAFFAGMCTLTPASAMATTTSVPTFDPDADVEIQDTGGERPDEYTVEQAFKKQNAALDRCVERAKGAAKGEGHVEVLLNPGGNRPLGINTQLPESLQKNADFRECVRGATAAAPFPSYDGPPVVVDLDFEIDPGYDVEEDW